MRLPCRTANSTEACFPDTTPGKAGESRFAGRVPALQAPTAWGRGRQRIHAEAGAGRFAAVRSLCGIRGNMKGEARRAGDAAPHTAPEKTLRRPGQAGWKDVAAVKRRRLSWQDIVWDV